MKTRNQIQKQREEDDQPSPSGGVISDKSRESLGKIVNGRMKKKKTMKKQDVSEGSNVLDKQKTGEEPQSLPTPGNTCSEKERQKGNVPCALPETKEDLTDLDWEDGFIGTPDSKNHHDNTVVVEFYDSPSTSKKKPVRRATAEEKELAELVHRVHLLCLLARGRLVDNACNDPLIQAALVSLLPSYLLKIADVPKLTAIALVPLVQWFHDNFKVESSNRQERSFSLHLAFALENRKGTAEEVAALSVALFRALNLTARFVSILDVLPLKPVSDGTSSQDGTWLDPGLFESSTLMVTKPGKGLNNKFDTPSKTKVQSPLSQSRIQSPSQKPVSKDKRSLLKELKDKLDTHSKAPIDSSGACETESERLKRKGDLEFELQLQMAVSATACEIQNKGKSSSELESLPSNTSYLSSPQNKFKRIKTEDVLAPSQGISTAIGSKKVGAPFYWAEVFCGAESEMGRWVHVDAINSLIGREEKVEAAISACKKNLRYVVAFAGDGAKDVTRRYCNKWYTISSKRVSSQWWDLVLAPLKQLESRASGNVVNASKMDASINLQSSRSSLEDMDLQTRALTEPLPTNQQAYRNHSLYAIERWLNRYEILRPKGPVLGYCSGHPVYPRTCVQTLQTKQRWLREGLQIKADESPAKVLKHSPKRSKGQTSEPSGSKEGDVEVEGSFALYGKWQTEPLDLPYAVNGIVPKNERGQVDVWSEKCLPHGTVHLRLPRVFSVAKRLGIDSAPAMVGFEFRNGRSYPVYEGIVVCSEFKDVILEAYAEEEVKRTAEERKQKEAQAASRWYQLLSSILTRQRLKETYGDGEDSTSEQPHQNESTSESQNTHIKASVTTVQPPVSNPDLTSLDEHHEHVFPTEDQSFDEESSVRTKRCPCGFLVQVEEF